MGYRDPRLVVVRDVLTGLVQLHDVSLVRRAHVLDVLVDTLSNMGLEVFHDLGGAQELVHYSLDHRQVIVVVEELAEGLVHRLLHEMAQMGLALVDGVPLPTARGQHVEIQHDVDAGEVCDREQGGVSLSRNGIRKRAPLAEALQAQAELKLLGFVMVPVVEIHEGPTELPVIDLDQREPASLPEPHDGHRLCLQIPLTRTVKLER